VGREHTVVHASKKRSLGSLPAPYFSPAEEMHLPRKRKRKIQRLQYSPMAAASIFVLFLGVVSEHLKRRYLIIRQDRMSSEITCAWARKKVRSITFFLEFSLPAGRQVWLLSAPVPM